jgi:hypothetical protein
VKEHLLTLQQLLEATNIVKEHGTEGGTSTILVEEEEIAHSVLTKLVVGNKTLQIEMDAIEFPTIELQE